MTARPNSGTGALSAPKVFLSYEFAHDAERAELVGAVWASQGGVVEPETVDPQDESSIRRWINGAVAAASVTVVLAGSHTQQSKWVDYEIRLTKALGNGLLAIDVSGIADSLGRTSECRVRLPLGCPLYDWVGQDGERNMRSWVDRAAAAAGQRAWSQSLADQCASALTEWG